MLNAAGQYFRFTGNAMLGSRPLLSFDSQVSGASYVFQLN